MVKSFAISLLVSLCLATIFGARSSTEAFVGPGTPTVPHQETIYNVKFFGAKGDGVADDTVSIQNALAAAGSNPGSAVFFPAGTYLFSQSLNVPSITIFGEDATLTRTASVALVLTADNVAIRNLKFRETGTSAEQFVLHVTSPRLHNFALVGNTFELNSNSFPFFVLGVNGTISSNQITGGRASRIELTQGLIENNIVNGNELGIYGKNLTIRHNTCGGLADGESFSKCTISDNEFDIPPGQIYLLQNCDFTDNQINRAEVTVSSPTSAGLKFQGVNTVVARNSVLGPFDFGIVSEGGQNNTITCNRIKNVLVGISLNSDTNTQVTANHIKNVAVGAVLQFDTKITFQQNVIDTTNLQPISLSVDPGTGVASARETDAIITENTIKNIQKQGILSTGGLGTVKIEKNHLQNCGLAASNPPAVIYVDSSGAQSIGINTNEYSGNTTNLSYFIRCLQSPPVVDMSGNSTTTLLPSQLGP